MRLLESLIAWNESHSRHIKVDNERALYGFFIFRYKLYDFFLFLP